MDMKNNKNNKEEQSSSGNQVPLGAPRPAIQLFDSEVARDPFPVYALMRDKYPICQLEPDGRYALTRYDDVTQALLRHDLFAAGSKVIGSPEWVNDEYKRDLFILAKDPPEHSQYRALVNKAFVPRVLDALVPHMRLAASSLVAGLKGHSNVEFLNDFALPYAIAVINRITGDTSQTIAQLKNWTELVDKNTQDNPGEGHIKALQAATKIQNDVYDRLIAERRREPQQDLLTELINAKIDGQQLTDREIRSGLDLFVSAGFQSSALFLTNTIHLLANHPDLRKALARDPGKIPQFIDEALRLVGPAHSLMRYARVPITLHGVTIPEGALVAIVIAAANRDERKFERPDTLDINRAHLKKQIALGHGIHTCIGAALSRVEVQIALETLLAEFEQITCPPDSELEWSNTLVIRMIRELPVSLC
jgi:cytochrome P450